MFDTVVQTLQTTRNHGYKFSQYSNNQSKRQLNCTRHQSQIIFYIKINVCGTIMQENKIRLNSFLCIPKRVDEHRTAVGACWRTKKSGWTINDQPYTKVLLCIALMICDLAQVIDTLNKFWLH